MQRPGEESSDLAWGSFIDSLNRDLALKSLTSLWRSLLDTLAVHRDLAQQLLQRTSQGDLAHDLLQRSSPRELAEPELVSLLFTTRVALVLLACSH